MTRTRLLVLTVGPLVIVGSTALAARLAGRERNEPADLPGSPEAAVDPVGPGLTDDPVLVAACCAHALRLQDLVGRETGGSGVPPVLVEPPFVLAGDLPRSALAAYWDDTIAPVALALWNTYFDRRPDRPVTVILCGDESGYRQCVRLMFGDDPRGYCGYYRRGEHALVVDVSAGRGAIAHELTHALLEFDFPACPQWFDEGLASLHEHCYLSQGRLVPLPDEQLAAAAARARRRARAAGAPLCRRVPGRSRGRALRTSPRPLPVSRRGGRARRLLPRPAASWGRGTRRRGASGRPPAASIRC